MYQQKIQVFSLFQSVGCDPEVPSMAMPISSLKGIERKRGVLVVFQRVKNPTSTHVEAGVICIFMVGVAIKRKKKEMKRK